MSIARLGRRLRRQGNHRLTITQFAALAAIERHHEMTPRELADHEKVQPPSMTRVITALELERLVERSPHPTDGRQVVVRVTDRGRTLMREERARKEAWLSQRLAELTSQERAILEQAAPILDKLSKA
ncbi:MarR family winged helix-turn-helix transcriptional regulator [Actinomadura craniellae]|nr:MarR family transcriptional regulator [Actinomadura craniellae]